MTRSLKKKKGIPPGLAQVRKQIPRPGKIFKSKKQDDRKRAKEELRMKKSLLRISS